MMQQVGKRIYRQATPDEKARHARIREQIAAELPEIQQRGRQHLAEAMQRGVALEQAMALLKAERRKQGLSLAEMKARTGMERSTLSRLETQPEANPTVATLAKYAEAVGKKILVVLVDADVE